MTDDGDRVGEQPVGVLQVFNKLGGMSIDEDEVARVKQVARLFGALSKKAQDITATQKSMITLLDAVKKRGELDFSHIDKTPYAGPMSQLTEELEFILTSFVETFESQNRSLGVTEE